MRKASRETASPRSKKNGGAVCHQEKGAQGISKTKEWLVRAGLVVFSPLVVFVLAELCLRLAGYGCPVTFLVQKPGSQDYITNERFVQGFRGKRSPLKPLLFEVAAVKPAGAIRICILGESAAMGTPDPAYSFGRLLEQMLREQYPAIRFEVLNAAMRGINSHKIRDTAREMARHQIDIFVVYMGNNEVVGYHGASPGDSKWAQSLAVIRTSHWVRSFRLGQLFASAIEPADVPEQTQAFFREHRLDPEDWRRDLNRRNFRENLNDICEAARASGARVLLSTVAVNLKDFAPLASLHREGLNPADEEKWSQYYEAGQRSERESLHAQAVENYRKALELDGHYAELHFRLARCLLAEGKVEPAKQHFGKARDLDALQFRTDARLNEVTEGVGKTLESKGVVFVDMEKALEGSNHPEGRIPGRKLFLDHVHPTFEGNYLIARALILQLGAMLEAQLGAAKSSPGLSPEACAAAVAYTPYDEINVNAAVLRMTAEPPFLDQADHARHQNALEAENRKQQEDFDVAAAEACLRTYLAAIKREPDYWPLRHNLAGLYKDMEKHTEALEQCRWLAQRYPRYKQFRLLLAEALRGAGKTQEAIAQLREALRLDPDAIKLRESLRWSASIANSAAQPLKDLRT